MRKVERNIQNQKPYPSIRHRNVERLADMSSSAVLVCVLEELRCGAAARAIYRHLGRQRSQSPADCDSSDIASTAGRHQQDRQHLSDILKLVQ